MEELGGNLDPSRRRANLMVAGHSLKDSRGKTLQVGDCRILIKGETRPCNLMEETLLGLRVAMFPDWQGGAFGEVLDDGVIRVGDAVSWVDPYSRCVATATSAACQLAFSCAIALSAVDFISGFLCGLCQSFKRTRTARALF